MKKLLLILAIVGLLLPVANAIFDPLEHYQSHKDMQSDRGMYKIDTAILGTDIIDVELIENTDHCLTNCYGILRIHPYLDLTNANTDKWQWTFKDTKENYLPFKSFTTKLKVPVIVPYETTECIKWQEIESINATNSSNKECIDYKITKHTRVKYEYQKFNWNNYNFPIGEDSYVKIEGSIGRGSAVDWIPIIEGFSLNNWAWWNSSYTYKRNITDIPSSSLIFPINGSGGSDIDNSSVTEQYYGYSGTGNLALYYNDENDTALANATDEFYMVQTQPEVNIQGSAPSNGLLAYYPLDNSNTYAWDFSGNDVNGTLVNTPTQGATGTFNSAYDFELSSSEYVNLGTDTWSDSDFSNGGAFCAWIKAESIPGQGNTILSIEGRAFLQYDEGNQFSIYTGIEQQLDGSTLSAGVWYFICGTWNTTNMYLYENATQVNSSAFSGDLDIDSCSRISAIGSSGFNPPNRVFDGIIDDVRIYNRLLSSTEIGELYNSSLNTKMMLGSEESSFMTIALGNVTETIYEESNLNPNITATSTENFEVYLYLENTNGSQYEIFNVSEAAGTYTNSSIKIDTTNYLDALYYLNATLNDTRGIISDTSLNFTIRNLHIWDLGNITCNGNLSGNAYFNLSFYSTENSTAEVTLSNAALSWSLYNLTYAGSGNYTNNSLLLNTNDYNSSLNYYLTVSVTDNIGNVESNSTCNFSIDNDVPAVTFDWLISNGWYSSLNHSVNFSVSDTVSPSISCNITYNAVDHSDVYTNGTINTLFANIVNGINWFNYTCNDSAGNSISASENIPAAYSQINIKKEEERGTDFPIENYTAYMFVSLASADNITYEETNSSKMKNWYFYVLNDTIKEIHLAIATDYYRSQTDLQTLTNVTFYMYNNTEFSSSQILFQIDTVGYSDPLIIKRPRTDTEDIITAEYPIGANREVNAYLLDSRLYNLYGYDADGKEQFISALMVSGSRIINIEIPTSYESFISTQSIYAHFTSAQIGDTDNYTLTASAKGTTYTIAIKNWSGSTLDSGIYAGTSALTVLVNKSLLNETNFYAEFNFTEGFVLRRSLSLGSPVIIFPELGWLTIGTDNIILFSIIALFLSFGVAGAFSRIDRGVGLMVGAALLSLLVWGGGLPNALHTISLILGLLGGASLLLNRE